jgi:hypothetical protein
MSTSALILMLAVWSVILAATGYCFYKLLNSERQFGQEEQS